MVDERLWQLLHDCDDYLIRQRQLLSRAGVVSPLDTVAMQAALDQLSSSVTSGWEAATAEDERIQRAPEPPPWKNLRGEPGE